MLVVAAAVLCMAGLAGAATTIDFLTTYDHDANAATANVYRSVVGTTHQYFDPNLWLGGVVPQYEGESVQIRSMRSYDDPIDPNKAYVADKMVLDLAGGVVDLWGRGYDPGNVNMVYYNGLTGAGVRYIDSSVGKTSYIKCDTFTAQGWGDHASDVPIVCETLLSHYRGGDLTTNAAVDANTIRVGQGTLVLNNPASGTVKANSVEIYNDSGWKTRTFTPEIVANTAISGCTSVTMAPGLWAEYEANADGALGTGTVDVVSGGSVTIGAAQTTFPTITLGENAHLGGDLTGATYGVGGNVQFQSGVILGDTSGGGNNPSRADANGATLYLPIKDITTTNTSGDNDSHAYMGVGLGRWTDSNSMSGTIQALATSGDLNIAIVGKEIWFDADSTLRGDGASTTANIKVFPGSEAQVTLTDGGINGNATGSDLITTCNIDGLEGDKSDASDGDGSTERFHVLKTSGTGAILPGQTFKITNGVYLMDTAGAVNTVGGKLIIGAGGNLDIRDSSSVENSSTGNYDHPATPVQFTATGSLEVQNLGLLKLPDGNSLGAVGSDASRVTVSGTPLVLFNRADDGYFDKWNAEVTIDAAANPGLQKILDQADIILHNCYRTSDTKRTTSFRGDGLNIREGGLVTTNCAVDTGNRPQTGVRADTVYFGPASDGGSFTIATPSGNAGIYIYCPVGSAGKTAKTININSTDPIETIVNTGWYPYTMDLGRVSTVPTGTVNFYDTIYADEVVVKNGTCVLNAATVDDNGLIVNVKSGGRLDLNGGAYENTSVTLDAGTYCQINGNVTDIKNLEINNGAYVDKVSGVKLNGTNTVISGRLSGTGSWGNKNYLRLGSTGTIAPGGNNGNDIGEINHEANRKGLWFQSGATIEWQITDPTPATPGVGWDAI